MRQQQHQEQKLLVQVHPSAAERERETTAGGEERKPLRSATARRTMRCSGGGGGGGGDRRTRITEESERERGERRSAHTYAVWPLQSADTRLCSTTHRRVMLVICRESGTRNHDPRAPETQTASLAQATSSRLYVRHVKHTHTHTQTVDSFAGSASLRMKYARRATGGERASRSSSTRADPA